MTSLFIRYSSYLEATKGHLISKCLFGVFKFFQKTNKNKSTWGIIVVKSNFFIRFLEELRIPKSPFEINWPLYVVKTLILFLKWFHPHHVVNKNWFKWKIIFCKQIKDANITWLVVISARCTEYMYAKLRWQSEQQSLWFKPIQAAYTRSKTAFN